jgi:hypothetical protein
MPGAVEETAEADPVVGLEAPGPGVAVVPVEQVVVGGSGGSAHDLPEVPA